MTQRKRTILCGLAVGAACVLAVVSLAHAGFCVTWGCSGNSATVGDGIVFDELNVNGFARKPDGVRIISAILRTTPVKLNVSGHVLTATAGGRTLREEELLGLVITLGKPDGRQYEAKIAKVCTVKEQLRYKEHAGQQPATKVTEAAKDVAAAKEAATAKQPATKVTEAAKDVAAAREAATAKEPAFKADLGKDGGRACPPLTFWVKPEDVVPYFELLIRKTHVRNPTAAVAAAAAAARHHQRELHDDRPTETEFKEQICKGEGLQKDVLWRDVKNSAIFYEGDYLDPDIKRVSETVQSDGWFNLACAGAVPAKMHLLRHTRAGSDSAHVTTTDQRTAMLKMITADYCGDGRARTADGTELRYKDARGWYSFNNWDPEHTGSNRIEAVWGPEGALCVNEPRRDPQSPTTPACTDPAVKRPEVAEDFACKARSYPKAPPWSGSTIVPHKIPKCDSRWSSEWHNAATYANDVYVISAVPPPAKGNYCDPP